MDNKTVYANEFASGELMNKSEKNETTRPARKQSEAKRSFSVTDIWNIRRSARKFKIHDRIPKL